MKKIIAYITFFAAGALALSSCGDSDDIDDDITSKPFYVIETEFKFPKEGGYQLLYVMSKNISWEIADCREWVSANPSTGSVSEGVRLAVEANPDTLQRRDTIIVRSTTASYPAEFPIIVIQAGK